MKGPLQVLMVLKMGGSPAIRMLNPKMGMLIFTTNIFQENLVLLQNHPKATQVPDRFLIKPT